MEKVLSQLQCLLPVVRNIYGIGVEKEVYEGVYS